MNKVNFIDNKDGLYTLRIKSMKGKPEMIVLDTTEAKRLKNQLNKIKEL